MVASRTGSACDGPCGCGPDPSKSLACGEVPGSVSVLLPSSWARSSLLVLGCSLLCAEAPVGPAHSGPQVACQADATTCAALAPRTSGEAGSPVSRLLVGHMFQAKGPVCGTGGY